MSLAIQEVSKKPFMRNFIFTIALFLISLGGVLGQNTLHQESNRKFFQFGLELWDKEKYSAAREQFERYLLTNPSSINRADAEYYIALCAIQLNNSDGPKLISEFVRNHPSHPKSGKAYYNLGKTAFTSADYPTANKYFKLASPNALTEEEQAETNFKIAYSAFMMNQVDEAAQYFDRAKVQGSTYFFAATYYSGFLAYLGQNYDKALVDLKRAEESPEYRYQVPVMISSAYFRQKRYGEVLNYTAQFKDIDQEKTRVNELYQVYQMAAESAFNEQNYVEAISFYQLYEQLAARSVTHATLYRQGVAFQAVGDAENAIEKYKTVALKDDSLAQFATYYLGQLYVQNNNYLFANNAFEKAAKLNFSESIQEEAYFNLAKVNFQTKKYSQAIQALDEFIKKYPDSSYLTEANNMLSEAFLNTRDFNRAISFIERLSQMTPRLRVAYQKVTFFKGTEYFNTGQYESAVQLFNKSLRFKEDKDLETAAFFWKAEALATARNYTNAIDAYLSVFKTRNTNSEYYVKANYGLGYAYYNTRSYSQARVYFKEYVDALETAEDRLNYDDAILRLADCYYVDKAYATAISYYQRAIDNDNPNTDYAYFQKGVVRDFQDKSDEAIEALDVVINSYSDSRYYDDAIYKKAQIQLEGSLFNESITGFTRIIEKEEQSPFIPYAYESRALAYFNINQLEKAEEDYKIILDQYVTSKVANSALLGLQNTLKLNDKSLEFERYLSRYKEANPDNQSLENIELESAKNLYFSQQYNAAIGAFEDYEKNYASSPLSVQAKFYRAESYYRLSNTGKALALYYELDREAQVTDIDIVFQRIGELQLKNGDFGEAVNYYSKLEKIAASKRQENEAWTGLLEANFRLSNFEKTRNYARLLIEKGNISPDVVNKAHLYIGKTHYLEGDYDTAIDHFLTTINIAKDQHGAEAQYLLGNIFFQNQQYEQSLNTLFEMGENYSNYEPWFSKAFLLIADNYMALDEVFQAKATVNSIIENSNNEAVLAEANQKLQLIQKMEEDRAKEEAADAVPADSTQQKGGGQ